MNPMDPMGWARTPAHQNPFLNKTPAAHDVCEKLTEIFVDKMQVVERIALAVNPETGQKEIHFLVDQESPFAKTWVPKDIQGIPVRLIQP